MILSSPNVKRLCRAERIRETQYTCSVVKYLLLLETFFIVQYFFMNLE